MIGIGGSEQEHAWFRKKPTADDIAAQGKAIFEVCVEAFKRAWTDLNPQPSTPEALAGQIEEFAHTAFRFMFTKFPLTKDAPRSFIWNTVFTAVLESKTHSTDEVNKAIELLRAKYAR
jgi:hypothetical protein